MDIDAILIEYDSVMGATGSGKSSVRPAIDSSKTAPKTFILFQFIKLLSGDSSVVIGNGLESETDDVKVVTFTNPSTSRAIRIVDTLGFDDSRENRSDTDILKKITDFLLTE